LSLNDEEKGILLKSAAVLKTQFEKYLS